MEKGKGQEEKADRVRIGTRLREILQMYLATIDTSEKDSPLFMSKARRNMNQRLTTLSISRIAKNALRRYGIDDRQVTAHSLRHTAATIALKTLPIDEVSKFMRHSSINTTMIYNHSITEETNRSEAVIECAVFGTEIDNQQKEMTDRNFSRSKTIESKIYENIDKDCRPIESKSCGSRTSTRRNSSKNSYRFN